MLAYIVRRLAALVPILIGVSLMVFALTRVMPGNICLIKFGPNATDEQLSECRLQYGLDKPLPQQYGEWVLGVTHGDLGDSLLRDRPVVDELADRLPITGQLLIMTVLITAILGISLGMLAAANRGNVIDQAIRILNISGMSVPSFFTGTLVIILPSIWFNYAPPFQHVSFFESPIDNLRQFGPPALILGFASSCGLARIVRGSILGVLGQDFMRTARAKGLPENLVLRRHALGNVMLPIVTILGLEIAALMGGTVIVETVFNLNGLGRLALEAVTTRDYPVIQAMALYTATVIVLAFLLIDLAYGWLDPRVRLTGGKVA